MTIGPHGTESPVDTAEDAALVRDALHGEVAHVIAGPDLYARVATGARVRRRRRTTAFAAAAAVAAVAVTGAVDPFGWRGGTERATVARPGATPSSLSTQTGTAMRDCPATFAEASSPSVSDGPLLPAKPGAMLLCVYTQGTSDYWTPPPGAILNPDGKTYQDVTPTPPKITWKVDSKLFSDAEAEEMAAALNGQASEPYRAPGYVGPDGVQVGDCLMAGPIHVLFFRNAAGQEATLRESSCFTSLNDGRISIRKPQAWITLTDGMIRD
ncbi:hypothetical protein [Yinghuangia soli]|uniref:Uncharacterized protein n=1 Tax=Yinghuangia soli TaxID=2908204 RepID=A0AA41PZK0_9ACTN|nr:hypothetical protein [Yinghuangia soli]MCF2528814.1 hypothetical protein [Yinghuangia soli]